MHGHVSYRGLGPSLVTGALLWLDRGSWTRTLVGPLHDTDSIYSSKKQLKTYLVQWRQSRIVTMFLRVTNTYLLTVIVTCMTKCYHETSINKTVKLHVPSSAVLEIENVNAKASYF